MQKELDQLREELTSLEEFFAKQTAEIEQRIQTLESSLALDATSKQAEEGAQKIHSKLTHKKKPKPDWQSAYPPIKDSIKDPIKVNKSAPKKITAPVKPQVNPQNKQPVPASTVSKPTQFKPQPTPLIQTDAFKQLAAIILPMLLPFGGLVDRFSAIYKHYQSEGRVPVFFLTTAGVVALVLSFAYLLQYSFTTYLSVTGKVLVGFSVAIATLIAGIRIATKKTDMQDYGSAIIGLGIILQYLCAYFAGPYYELIPPIISLACLAAIGLVAYFIALRFHTRVVALVSHLGGASLPLLLDSFAASPLIYLAYLWLLTLGSFHIAKVIRWHALSIVAMIASIGMIEVMLYQLEAPINGLALSAFIMAFFYLFSLSALKRVDLSEGGSSQVNSSQADHTPIPKDHVAMILSSGGFLLFAHQHIALSSQVLGLIAFLNAGVWLALSIFSSLIFTHPVDSATDRWVKSVSILFVGLLAGIGAMLLIHPDLLGVVWCLEALLLLYLGAQQKYLSVRLEGYLALLIACSVMLVSVIKWLTHSVTKLPALFDFSLHIALGHLVAIALTLCAVTAIYKKYTDQLNEYERFGQPMIQTMAYAFMTVSALLGVGILSVDSMWLAGFVFGFLLLFESKRVALPELELLGLISISLLFFPITASALHSGNLYFEQQSLIAKVSTSLLFISLWAVPAFFKFVLKTSSVFDEWMVYSEKSFVCLLPIFFLPSVFRFYEDYLVMALWVSAFVALYLYQKKPFRVLNIELKVLSWLASIAAISGCIVVAFGSENALALPSLLCGLFYFGCIGWQSGFIKHLLINEQKIPLNKDYHYPLVVGGVLYFNLSIVVLSYGLTSSLPFSGLMAMMSLLGLYALRSGVAPIRQLLILMYCLIFALGVVL
ncbi:MAG: DUF2339 domain-containing protein, partial [Cellvibrionales bacterium]|nr:DUF2339 domain-containing protein [Cellvibrionales bacterium]